jgi:gamma-glutamyltranspeptidase/glutathione hydrolase
MTTTVNGYFGSHVMGPKSGVVLNNQIDDFALKAGVPNMFGLIQSEANLVGPGKKPLSSMTPTLVFKQDKVVGCFGGSGGPRIISNTFQSILNVFAFGMPIQDALSAPRIHHQWLPNAIVHEEGMNDEQQQALKAKGHELKLSTTVTAVQSVVMTDQGISAASDPRKGGQPALEQFRELPEPK